MKQFAAKGVAGFQDGAARARGGGRSAGDRCRRKARIADFDGHRAEIDAEAFRRHLSEHRIDTIADFMRGGLHSHIAIRH